MVVLDAWALLAYLRDEPAAECIEAEWLARGAAICTVNLGEALYIRVRARGIEAARSEIAVIRKRSDVIDADWQLVAGAAEIKASGGLSYADAFCIATAQRLHAPLWTGDPEIVARAASLRCEIVDLREEGF